MVLVFSFVCSLLAHVLDVVCLGDEPGFQYIGSQLVHCLFPKSVGVCHNKADLLVCNPEKNKHTKMWMVVELLHRGVVSVCIKSAGVRQCRFRFSSLE